MASELLSNRTIWILEDDESCQFVYSEALELRYKLRFFKTVKEFRKEFHATQNLPELLIADLRLPGESFLRFLAQEEDLSALERVPFIIISSIDDIDILKRCFEGGAIDYMTKPFSKSELVVKIDRILSLEGRQADAVVSVDNTNLMAVNGAGEVRLTPKEMQILSVLREQAGMPVSREAIIQKVWDQTVVGSKTLDVHLFNLRKKTKGLGVEIRFVPPNSLQLLGEKNANG